MRDIEFRVWDGENYCSLAKALKREIIGWQEPDGQTLEVWFDCIVIEQYTGLKDKNGVKIFEGDKVIVHNKKQSIFNEEAHVIFYANGWYVDMSPYYRKCREGWLVNINAETHLEIIGHIHEQN